MKIPGEAVVVCGWAAPPGSVNPRKFPCLVLTTRPGPEERGRESEYNWLGSVGWESLCGGGRKKKKTDHPHSLIHFLAASSSSLRLLVLLLMLPPPPPLQSRDSSRMPDSDEHHLEGLFLGISTAGCCLCIVASSSIIILATHQSRLDFIRHQKRHQLRSVIQTNSQCALSYLIRLMGFSRSRLWRNPIMNSTAGLNVLPQDLLSNNPFSIRKPT